MTEMFNFNEKRLFEGKGDGRGMGGAWEGEGEIGLILSLGNRRLRCIFLHKDLQH